MKEIEEFLKETKPQVKDDPTFILNARRRMEQVEGIKAEVDRQRRSGRVALIAALAIGLAVGVTATALAFLYPVDATSLGEGLWSSIRAFLDQWKQYLVYPVAALATALCLVLAGRRNTSRI